MPKLTTLKPRIQCLHSAGGERTGWADQRRGSRHQRGYGAEWERKRKRALQRDAGLCQPCKRRGRVTLGNDVDHRINKARGGDDSDGNLQTICPTCHKAKTAAESRGMDWDETDPFGDPGPI